MWLSEEEKEKQRRIEKLIDWEIKKQLTWAVLVLTFLSSALQLLSSSLVKSTGLLYFELPLCSTIKVHMNLVFTVLYALMIFGLDSSFYRLTVSYVRLREWQEMLPEFVFREPLIEKFPLKWFFDPFVKRTNTKDFSLRKELTFLLIGFGDFWLILALLSILIGTT